MYQGCDRYMDCNRSDWLVIGAITAGLFGVGTPPVTSSYESISTVTLGSTQTTISFTSIPSTFKHLQVRGIARGTFAATNLNLCMQVNSDTSSSYTYHQLLGDGSSATAQGGSAQSFGFVGRIAQASATASAFGASVIDILDYADTNKNTTIRALGGYDANGNGYATLMSTAYLKTDAINSIQIFGNLGDLVQFSSFALYGIKG